MNRAFFLFLFFVAQVIVGQEITVVDEESKEPLAHVAVYNDDKSKNLLTDVNGICNLDVFDKNERIFFQHITFQTQRTTKTQIQRQGNVVSMMLIAEQLDEVVMSISKWEQQKKTIPQKTTAISSKIIDFVMPQTSADMLQSSGKIFVQKSQLGGGSPMIRGFATNRLLLAVDGVRMNNAIFRGGNLQNVISIDPFTVKNTEVIFGPGSVIYGSDAMGGVMNFYTKNPDFSAGEELLFQGESNYRFSSANNEQTGHLAFNFGKQQWAFLSSITYNHFDDLKMGKYGPSSYERTQYIERLNGEDVLIPNDKPRVQLPTGYNQINLMQKVAFKPSHMLKLVGGLYYSETSDYARYDRLIRPRGGGLRSAEWYYGPQKWFMGNLQLNRKGKNTFYDEYKITAAYQFFEESRHDRDFQDVIKNNTQEQVDAISLNVDMEHKKIGNLRLYYGGEYVFNKVHSSGSSINIENNEEEEAASRYPDGSSWQTLAGYVSGEYQIQPNISVLSGLRYSHVWINADFDTTYFDFPFTTANLSTGALTGSIGVSWFPKANTQITFNGSTGFRAPNIDDIGKVFDSEPGAVVVPNPDLEPEYAYNIELGLQQNIADKVIFKGAAFYTYLVDALVRRDFQFNGASEIAYNGELSRVQAIQNAAKAYVYGFELGLEAYLSQHVSVLSNLTLTEGTEEEEDGSKTPGRHVAPAFGDIHLIWKNQRLKADVFLTYNGEISNANLAASEQSKTYMYAVDANGNPYAPSWHTLNFRSQYAFTDQFKSTLAVENISNQRYRPYSSGIVAAGTNVVLGVAYTF